MISLLGSLLWCVSGVTLIISNRVYLGTEDELGSFEFISVEEAVFFLVIA